MTHPDGSYELREWNRQGAGDRVEYYEADGTLVHVTTTDYDNLGRKTRETVGIGADEVVTTYVYHGSTENVTRQTVVHPTDSSQNRVTHYFYDAAGKLIRQVDPDLNVNDPTGRHLLQVRRQRQSRLADGPGRQRHDLDLRLAQPRHRRARPALLARHRLVVDDRRADPDADRNTDAGRRRTLRPVAHHPLRV